MLQTLGPETLIALLFILAPFVIIGGIVLAVGYGIYRLVSDD